jgi:trigger factor
MQVTETLTEGLKRELKVVVAANELTQRFTSRLDEVKNQVQLKGFRKGKVPVGHLKKLYGRSVMAEVLQQAVEETSRKAVSDRNERLARQPNINLSEDKEEIERVLSGQSDLAFTMSYETLPEIKITDLAALKLEREVADVAPEAVEKGVGELLERSIRYEVQADRAAEQGDRLTIDFVGRIDGAEFEGGKGEDVPVVLGQSGFIPGFEDGLKGAKPAEERVVQAKFPAEYPQQHLAGKDAAFEVKVKEVAKPIRPELNDEFAKTLGVDSLARLRELVGAKIGSEYASVAHMKLKRQILDALDKAHDFVLPESLVTGEFDMIWRQVTESLKSDNKTFPETGKSEEELRADYRKIAERRVEARADRAGQPLSGPAATRLRLLRKEPGGVGRAASADFRGQGHRPHCRAGKAGGEEGVRGGPVEADGGGERLGPRPSASRSRPRSPWPRSRSGPRPRSRPPP